MGGADHPLKIDSRKPTVSLESVALKEGRYAMLAQTDPARSKMLLAQAQHAADARWQLYEQVAGVHRVVTDEGQSPAAPPGATAQPAAAGDKSGAAAPQQEAAK